MGKRRKIIDALHYLRFFDALPRQHQLTVLSYHRLGEAFRHPNFHLDQTVFGPSAQVFDDQMKWLAKNCSVISEDDLLGAISGAFKLPRRSVLVTFDDAYKDQYTIGLPSLVSHRIPAIFFVTPGLVNQRSLGFWDRLARAIHLTQVRELDIAGIRFDLTDRTAAKQAVIHWVKYRTDDPYQLTAQIEDLLQVHPVPSELEDGELMSWQDLQTLSRDYRKYGISIGAHGYTHRLLETLSREEQRWELVEGKTCLEQTLKCSVKSLAYPAGSSGPDTKELALQCGYTAIFSFESGINPKKFEADDIKRVPAGKSTALVACAASLTWGLGATYYP